MYLCGGGSRNIKIVKIFFWISRWFSATMKRCFKKILSYTTYACNLYIKVVTSEIQKKKCQRKSFQTSGLISAPRGSMHIATIINVVHPSKWQESYFWVIRWISATMKGGSKKMLSIYNMCLSPFYQSGNLKNKNYY